MTAEHVAHARALLHANLDWDVLLGLAVRHKMLPLVWWHLKTETGEFPERVAQQAQQFFVENARRMLRLSGELLDITELLGSHGVLAVPYKGPVLGAHVYGNLVLRQAGDLDLLVDRRDVGRARALLANRGYGPRHILSRGGGEFMLRSRYSEVLEAETRSTVELHWAFTNGDVGLPLGLADLAPNLRTIRFGGGTVQMFGDEDLLLILCIHGSKHRWDRVEWLCGVAEVLRARSKSIDWGRLQHRAEKLGARRMLQLGIMLAHDLLGASAPEAFLTRSRLDGAVKRLAATVPTLFTTCAVDGDGVGNLATDYFRFQLRERIRHRLQYVWYRLTTPSRPESWSAVSVGNGWVPTHGLARPFRIMSKLFLAFRPHHLPTRLRSRAAHQRGG